MANKVSEEKREFARVLYMSGEQQNIIAEKVGVSNNHKTGGWQRKRGTNAELPKASHAPKS